MTQEDKIRKEMIDFISVYIKAHGCTDMNKWITYLEKQDEQKQVNSKFTVVDTVLLLLLDLLLTFILISAIIA